MVKPERRTRGDILAAAAIVVVIALVTLLIWWTSDARATVSRPAAAPAPNPSPAREVPGTLKQLWTANSPATRVPMVAGGTVATGAGRLVEGRNPTTGETLWSYSRDTDLCGVSWVYRYAVAVYRDDRGCGQVSTIDGSTGRRGPARSSYADPKVRLSSDGTTVLSAGSTRLELWRSDMVRMLSYGETDARVKAANRGLHSGCTLESAAASSSAVSVLEACQDQADLRLVLLRPGKEEDEPEQRIVPEPGIRAGSGARVLIVSQNNTAVYLPSPQPHVEVIDETGTTTASTLLPKPPSPAAVVSQTGNLVTWWTGDALLVFNTGKLTQRYTIAAGDTAAPLGPGVMMAGQVLVPVTGALGVYDPVSGASIRYIPVDRQPNTSAVIPVVVGSTVIEQRGDAVVALG
ncbi:hypothetical protein OSH39_02210 [Mycobacterium ulcerans]|uniref:Conserved alanine and valine rich protein n=2 Tax=Mycobacterium ulcerans TaxID=1809 RepID=A0PRA8_MYCUA|nr:hypothetical protein [Mycobacterium ulcerans]ABL04877.1 conserved alanine and valine rich protein [Mycobacterium ulcerans Agy99]MEB3904083.1 hypothetical protein [Mycobacterium ulcerans]MEB3908255.1 hypothetical protein [Mycobacterium ulcerans]MEB3918555.1 hypothetical protein [Mycobacterium ulcerans]MEB3922651.1 hypothetical protein [Mycobacterium ulcerans]